MWARPQDGERGREGGDLAQRAHGRPRENGRGGRAGGAPDAVRPSIFGIYMYIWYFCICVVPGASSALLRDLLDAPTAPAACCGSDLCHKYILYLCLYLNLRPRARACGPVQRAAWCRALLRFVSRLGAASTGCFFSCFCTCHECIVFVCFVSQPAACCVLDPSHKHISFVTYALIIIIYYYYIYTYVYTVYMYMYIYFFFHFSIFLLLLAATHACCAAGMSASRRPRGASGGGRSR